jgi:superfamily I DNA/RNA helicase/RecB family exonuclease
VARPSRLSYPVASMTSMTFEPDPEQSKVLDHRRGVLLLTGGPGTGKSTVLRERFARLIEEGSDPERVALVVRTKHARAEARRALLQRLSRPLPGMKLLTVHGLANHVIGLRYEALGYQRPPEILSAPDQFSKVQELLAGEVPTEWPTYGTMLALRGFADEVRQLILRAQEALITPEEMVAKADASGLPRWRELASFYRRYLQVLDDMGMIDYAGLVNQAAAASGQGEPQFDHLLVDDYQEATFAAEALIVGLHVQSLVVAGDEGSHVFSFQGTTDVPLRRFLEQLPTAEHVSLGMAHRCDAPRYEAWSTPHSSEETAAVARELRRIHVEDGVPWAELAVIVRREGSHVGGLLRALDDARVPRTRPEGGLSLLAEPATFPFVLALRWLARPEDRDGLAESILTSELARLSPAAARGLVRAALAADQTPSASLQRADGLTPEEAAELRLLSTVLGEAEVLAGRSVLDAFSILWRKLPYARRLIAEGETSPDGARDLDAVLAFSEAVSRAGERSDSSVLAFLEVLEAGEDGPGPAELSEERRPDAVRVFTSHGSAGREFDTVIVVGATEGNFPSLSRPESMFDLAPLDGRLSQSHRNRFRLLDERRLFHVVASRARRRVVFTASDPHDETTVLTARSRFVSELGVAWAPAPGGPFAEPLSVAEAAASWRRGFADASRPPALRLAALRGLLAVGDSPARWWFGQDWTGTDRPLHEGIRVSFSKLDTLENCALQYVLSEELGLEGQAGYYAWVGHLVHRIIEDCESGFIHRTEEALVAAAEDRWQPAQFPSHAVSEAFRRVVTRKMLPTWLVMYGQTPALAGEIRFNFDFAGATVTGAIDRVGMITSGGSQITDYKTGKARGGPAEENLQLGIYYLAVSQADELGEYRPVKAVELAFLKENVSSRNFRVQLGMNSRAQHEFREKMGARLSGLIEQIRDLLRTEVYRPSPEAECRYCDFKTLCPLWPEGRELFPVAAEARHG